MSQATRAPRRPSTAPGAAAPARRAVPGAIVVLATAAVLGGAGLAAHERLDRAGEPVLVGQSVSFAELRVAVVGVERRVDAVAGVNAKPLPMSGPAMPMGMGMSAQGMAGMPGMAGMLHPGEERLDVRLEVLNDGDRASALAAAEFRLTSRGRPVPLLQPSTSEIRGDLAPGFSVAGTVTFVIPEGTAPLELHYAEDRAGVLLDADEARPGASPSGTHAPAHR
jgi:hypothetical protein